MYAVIASASLLCAVLVFGFAYAAARRPLPPPWVLGELGGVTISLTVVFLLSIGIGFAANFAAGWSAQAMPLPQALVLGSTPFTGYLLWRLTQRRRAAVEERPTAVVLELPTAGSRDCPPTTPQRPGGRPVNSEPRRAVG